MSEECRKILDRMAREAQEEGFYDYDPEADPFPDPLMSVETDKDVDPGIIVEQESTEEEEGS